MSKNPRILGAYHFFHLYNIFQVLLPVPSVEQITVPPQAHSKNCFHLSRRNQWTSQVFGLILLIFLVHALKCKSAACEQLVITCFQTSHNFMESFQERPRCKKPFPPHCHDKPSPWGLQFVLLTHLASPKLLRRFVPDTPSSQSASSTWYVAEWTIEFHSVQVSSDSSPSERSISINMSKIMWMAVQHQHSYALTLRSRCHFRFSYKKYWYESNIMFRIHGTKLHNTKTTWGRCVHFYTNFAHFVLYFTPCTEIEVMYYYIENVGYLHLSLCIMIECLLLMLIDGRFISVLLLYSQLLNRCLTLLYIERNRLWNGKQIYPTRIIVYLRKWWFSFAVLISSILSATIWPNRIPLNGPTIQWKLVNSSCCSSARCCTIISKEGPSLAAATQIFRPSIFGLLSPLVQYPYSGKHPDHILQQHSTLFLQKPIGQMGFCNPTK